MNRETGNSLPKKVGTGWRKREGRGNKEGDLGAEKRAERGIRMKVTVRS